MQKYYLISGFKTTDYITLLAFSIYFKTISFLLSFTVSKSAESSVFYFPRKFSKTPWLLLWKAPAGSPVITRLPCRVSALLRSGAAERRGPGRCSMLGSRETGSAGGREAAAGPPGPQSREHRGEEAPAGRAGCRLTGLVNWRQRPCRTSALFAAANTVIW